MLHHKLRRFSSTNIKDSNFKNVALLLSGNGTNGGQNNTFLDSSNNAFTITRFGNSTQGTFSPYGTLWSNYWPGTTALSGLTLGGSLLGSSNFCMEMWFYINDINTSGGTTDYAPIVNNYQYYSGLTNASVDFAYDKILNRIYFSLYTGGGSNTGTAPATSVASATNSIALGEWYHVAIVRDTGTLKMFLDGVLVSSSTITNDTAVNFNTRNIYIGRYESIAGSAPTNRRFFKGYISNFRLVVGSAVYTSNFTPSTTTLTAISNTSRLTCQSNRFIDNSVNNFAITVAGDISVQRFSPFDVTEAYSSTTDGSGYFDDAGDYLTLASNAAFAPGTGAFTWEGWFYPTAAWAQTATTGDNLWATSVTNGVQIGRPTTSTGNSWGLAAAGTAWRLTSTTLPTINQWNHMAVSRSGTGTNQTALFLNGSRIAVGTVTDNFAQGLVSLIGTSAGGSDSTGFFSDFRFVNGSAVYNPANTTYTVPTSPLSTIANTSFLCKFTNASIIDGAAINDLETVGNAQISTSIKRFGTGSLAFDGTGDWLALPDSPVLNIGTIDFTVECWVNRTAAVNPAGADAIVTKGLNNICLFINSNVFKFSQYSVGDICSGTTTIVNGTWYHVAVTRSGTTVRLFVNGILESTGTSSGNFSSTTQMRIAGDPVTTSQTFNGYIDDFRITRGVARYTANFTPPLIPFSNF